MLTRLFCLLFALPLFAGTPDAPCRLSATNATPRDAEGTPRGMAKSDWTSIRAAHEAWRLGFQPIEGGWQARNPGQRWTTRFDERGFLTKPREGDWTWGLKLTSYGRGERQITIGERASERKAEGQRLSYQWDGTVEEWWVNDTRGLEHGYTIAQRPEGTGAELHLVLATRGTLTPKVADDALGVLFRNAAGNNVLNYTGLKVWDADGKVLASHFDAAGEKAVCLVVDDRAARYPVTIDPIAQQAYLKPAQVGTTQSGDRFGYSVAVSGDTVVVGSPLEASSTTGTDSTPDEGARYAGAAYVFVRRGTTWSQEAYLKPAAVGTTQAFDNFGTSVAVSGDMVVVGAIGEDSNTTGINSTPNEGGRDAGAAYVFVRHGTTWSQEAYLKPAAVGTTQAFDNFGISVAVSGDTVIVGAYQEDSGTTGTDSTPNEDALNAGAAYVFVRRGTTWSQEAYLKPAAVGITQEWDFFGISVAVSDDTVVVGASLEDSSTPGIDSTPDEGARYAGAAYVFVRRETTWSQEAYLKPAAVGTTQAGDNFGTSVAVSGDTVVVGAIGEDSNTTGINNTPNEGASSSGATYVFVRRGSAWSQQAFLKPAKVGPSQADDSFGTSVAVSGDTVVVGANGEDSSMTGINGTPNEGAGSSGAAYVFVRRGTAWSQQAFLKPAQVGTAQEGDWFGVSVAVSGDTVVVGANQEASGTTGINSTPDELAMFAGAAYIFAGFGAAETPELAIRASGSDFLLTLTGVPGNAYRVQYTTTLSPPDTWNEFVPPAVYTAPVDGIITHTDLNPPGQVRLYRTIPDP